MLVLKDMGTEELAAALGPAGGLRLARRLQSLAVKRHALELPAVDGEFKRAVWTDLRDRVRLPHLDLLESRTSPTDGFTRYLFRGDGPEVFEAVRIPLLHRPGCEKYVVCVSSQVGCTAGCAFCATGRLGFRRNLATWEIVDQVVKVAADSAHPVRGVVFMGMGEPLLNYERVLKAASIISEPSGLAIDARAVTISTVGVPRMIRRLAAARRRLRLITSIHSAIPEVRDQLVPLNRAYPLPEVFSALREYHAATGKRVVLAWTMISGVNMSVAEARALKGWLDGMPAVLDLIPVNDGTGRFRPPDRAELSAWLDTLRAEVGIPVVVRYSGGQDIDGACGMLAGQSAGAGGVETATTTPARLTSDPAATGTPQ